MARTATQSSSRRRAPAKGATARRSQRKQSSEGLRVPGWLWALLGLVAGFALAQYFQQSAPPMATLMPKPASQTQAPSSSSSSSGKAQAPAKDESRMPTFEFYTLLPESEVVAPKVEAYQSTPRPSDDTSDKPDAGQAAKAAGGGSFMLQAASFKNVADAKRLAGRLQNLGLLAKITAVQANGNQTWHRVQVGPYEDTRELSRAQDLMVTQGIEPLMIKLQN
ncbi:SPOR domain-containing protein [Halomonas sp. HP20-15]|uniref:SPOR domain-containing protein n=1 Tax=Halomonas sp. HP20-15 TaxID=3085901 RepID=UPI0029821D00|nr:SPOR domain-containing protein [Halomonas sp. HP20-15]MDW5376356.1 SPOR domain-containing protein [Halomonas sp. HP20-15]